MWMRVVLLVLVGITVWKLLAAIGSTGDQSLDGAGSWSWRDDHVLKGSLAFDLRFVALAAAVEGNHGGVRYVGLADGALWMLVGGEGGALDVKPFVDARPAVEVAAKGHHGLVGKLQTDVAVEATIGIIRVCCYTLDGFPLPGKVVLKSHRSRLTDSLSTENSSTLFQKKVIEPV